MRIPHRLGVIAFLAWIVALAASPVIYLGSLGPSTVYRSPQFGNATKGPDGRSVVYLGDEFFVWINIRRIRHWINWTCTFDISRYAEVEGGPRDGRRYLISKTRLQFVGQNDSFRTRWPQPDEPKIILGYGVNEDNEPQKDQPLLPAGIDEQEFAFFVIGRYYCNAIDYIIPRYIQGGDTPNETERIYAVVKRHKP